MHVIRERRVLLLAPQRCVAAILSARRRRGRALDAVHPDATPTVGGGRLEDPQRVDARGRGVSACCRAAGGGGSGGGELILEVALKRLELAWQHKRRRHESEVLNAVLGLHGFDVCPQVGLHRQNSRLWELVDSLVREELAELWWVHLAGAPKDRPRLLDRLHPFVPVVAQDDLQHI